MSDSQNACPKMGRPPLPRDKARVNRVVTFVTNEQLAKLNNLANRSGQTLSRTAYQLLKTHLD